MLKNERGVGIPVEVSGISRTFGSQRVLDNVSFKVSGGQVCGLLGHNGAGKSTLINIITATRRADKGRCIIAGHEVSRNGPAAKLVSLMPQGVELPEYLSVKDTLALVASHYPNSLPIDEALRVLDVGRLAERYGGGLSLGESKSVAFACALASNAPLLILDEPSAGLDVRSQDALSEAILQARDDGRTILLASHNMGEVAAVCDQVVLLDHGVVSGVLERSEFARVAGGVDISFASSLSAAECGDLLEAGGFTNGKVIARDMGSGRIGVVTEDSDAVALFSLRTLGATELRVRDSDLSDVLRRLLLTTSAEGKKD